jgi:murein L,D-transpeptidase YafK
MSTFRKIKGREPSQSYPLYAGFRLLGCRIWLCTVLASFAFCSHTAALSADPVLQADRIVVLKAERRLLLMREEEVLKSFWIALGRHPIGPKTKRGDGRTPEGIYRIEARDSESFFYRSLRISYPNRSDRERAKQLGVHPGGNILIHAVPKGFGPTGPGERMFDWTNGCIAVTDADMDEIWSRAPEGISVEIRP